MAAGLMEAEPSSSSSSMEVIYEDPPKASNEELTTAASPSLGQLLPSRRFLPDGKVTSVDLSVNGYVIVGCSDGTVRLYSMVDPDGWGTEGLILSQIHAKGLITNLIFHVEVTDDSRYAFAGVLRGSMEMFAYDLTRLPHGSWGGGDHDERKVVPLSKEAAEALIECHTNCDPKLRGFGAVARIGRKEKVDPSSPPEYLIACGLSIKTIHAFLFREGVGEAPPTWECVFDRSSNGMSLELLAIRAGGTEIVSKSNGQNLRVWNLKPKGEGTADRGGEKATFIDINNTQDIRIVCGDYAFGGNHGQLSLVRLDAASEMNRMELALPANTMGGSNRSGKQQKRRQLCSVKDVIGTHGGGSQNKVLVICSDGGVHCYENTGPSAVGELVPVYSLALTENDDVSFSLATAMVGDRTAAMVIQTRWLASENHGEILVEPLKLGQPKEEVVAQRRALGSIDKNTFTTSKIGDLSSSKRPITKGVTRGSETQSDALQVKKVSNKRRSKDKQQGSSGSKDGSRGAPKLSLSSFAAAGNAASTAVGLCKPLVRRPSQPPAQPPAPIGPVKRKHYDPFTSIGRGKKGKNQDPFRDAEMKRLSEEAAAKSSDFFREHLVRQDLQRNVRITPVQYPREAAEDEEEEEEDEEEVVGVHEVLRLPPLEVITPSPPVSTMKTWAELRDKHQKEKGGLAQRFTIEHDWLRMRFLDAVERERLMHHIQRQAIPPSSIKDPLRFLWWHNSRLPIKKQWYRSQTKEAMNSLDYGLPRRFSLFSVISNYKDMAARMVRRQQVEADTLGALQTMELPYGQVQVMKVKYPYASDWKNAQKSPFTPLTPTGPPPKQQEEKQEQEGQKDQGKKEASGSFLMQGVQQADLSSATTTSSISLEA